MMNIIQSFQALTLIINVYVVKLRGGGLDMKKQRDSWLILMGITTCSFFAIADLKTYCYSYSEYGYISFMPLSFIKVWGIFFNNYSFYATLAIIWFLILRIISNRESVHLNYHALIPPIISIFASIFFVVGVGNVINKLYKRALIQFIMGLILDIMHFYLVIGRWNLSMDLYFNTRLWSVSLILLIYMSYVVYDTYQCALAKEYNEPYPKFMGLKIDG